MEKEKVREALDQLRADPKAKELFAAIPEPESREDYIQAYVQVAGEMGMNLTEKEVSDCLAEQEAAVKTATDSAAETIRKLGREELDAVAGGGEHSNCDYSFKDKENCWLQDGCDCAFRHPSGYVCKRSLNCDKGAAKGCKEASDAKGCMDSTVGYDW